jgi:hypothetical protein
VEQKWKSLLPWMINRGPNPFYNKRVALPHCWSSGGLVTEDKYEEVVHTAKSKYVLLPTAHGRLKKGACVLKRGEPRNHCLLKSPMTDPVKRHRPRYRAPTPIRASLTLPYSTQAWSYECSSQVFLSFVGPACDRERFNPAHISLLMHVE